MGMSALSSSVVELSDQNVAVEVAVFAPLPGSFSYLWPDSLGKPLSGIRVQVPFGKGTRFGLVLAVTAVTDDEISTFKSVGDRLEVEPLLDHSRLAWLERVGRYYLASPGELWSTSLGWALQDDLRRFRCSEPARLAAHPLLANLFTTRAAVTLKTILKRAAESGSTSGARYALSRAVETGLVRRLQRNRFYLQRGIRDLNLSQQ